jgi:transcriptional regulator with XRE-family HTH domain
MKDRGLEQNLGPCIATADRNGVPYSIRLKRAREAICKSPEETAAVVGVSVPTYYDWEWGEGDISSTASLRDLARLSAALGVPTAAIFEDDKSAKESVSPAQLAEKVQAHLDGTGTTIADFEDRVGFVIEPFLRDPSKMLSWNLDCLRFVCRQVGVDWHDALP